MFALDINEISNFGYVRNMKKQSCDMLMSVFNDKANEKDLHKVINRLLTKEYNEIVSELTEETTQEEVNEWLQAYTEDFEQMLDEEIKEHKKCVLNRVGDVMATYNGEEVRKIRHTKENKEGGFVVHSFNLI